MDGASDTRSDQVCKAQNGQYIAFWRGQVVCKLDGALRYFDSQEAAQLFLARRAAVADSMIGAAGSPRTARPRPGKGA